MWRSTLFLALSDSDALFDPLLTLDRQKFFLPPRSYNSVATCAAASSVSASASGPSTVSENVSCMVFRMILTKSQFNRRRSRCRLFWRALDITSLAVSSLISSGFNPGRLWEKYIHPIMFQSNFFLPKK